MNVCREGGKCKERDLRKETLDLIYRKMIADHMRNIETETETETRWAN